MADEIKEENMEIKPKAIITILLNPDGSTELKSSIQAPMVSHILVSMLVSMHLPKQAQSRIAMPGGILNFARKLRR